MADAGARILFVDDDEGFRTIVARHLRARGHEVAEAATAQAALDALRSWGRPDLVLLDLELPGETGWDVVGSDALVAAGTPPVVIASATPVGLNRLARMGIAGYLRKPFALDALVATVDRVVGRGLVDSTHDTA
jgi:two-component system, OmpR family, KDP operon response regulator KdpE